MTVTTISAIMHSVISQSVTDSQLVDVGSLTGLYVRGNKNKYMLGTFMFSLPT